MKTVTSSEKPPRQVDGSWLKALARRLRDWLNGFLREPSRSAIDGHQGRGARAAQGQDSSANPRRAEQTDAPSWRGLVEDPGPPEEWLALVREGAPELLLPVEEGGTPWHGVSSAMMEESKPAEEHRSPPAAPPPPPESRSLHSAPGIFSKPEDEESQPGQEPFRSPLPAAQKSEKSAEPSAPAPLSPWTQRIKQRFADVLPKAQEKSQASPPSNSPALPSAKWTELQAPLSEAYHGRRQSTPECGSTFRGPEARRSTAEVDRNLLEQPVTLQRSELAFGGVARSGRSPRDDPASATTPRRGQLFPDKVGESAAPKREFASAGTDQGKLERRPLPTAPAPPDAWPVSSRRSQKSERDDPWPELPENQPVASARWREFLRSAERLRALDLEQRGGR